VKAAADYLSVSRWTITRLMKAGTLPTYRSPIDRRHKLVDRKDLDRLRKPQRDNGSEAA